MRRTFITLLFLTGVSFVLGLWLLGPGAGGDVHAPRTENPTRAERGAPLIVAAGPTVGPPIPSRSSRTDISAERSPTRAPLQRGPDLTDDELRARLRRLAAVDLSDAEAFEAVLEPLLTNAKTMERIVFLLQGRGLARADAVLSPEEVGALRAIGAGAVVFNSGDVEGNELVAAGLAVDGRAYLVSVLEALVNVAAPAKGLLAGMLRSSRDAAGRLLISLELATELDRLARQDPASADLYLGLLAEAAGELDDTGARALDLNQLTDARSPTLVNASLARLLEGESSPAALQWAAALHDGEETDAALKRAISTAVAAAAPVAGAAAFLSARADAELLVEFDLLGGREGGLEALQEEYYTLRVFDDADETARTMLVAGMGRAAPSNLLAIAVDDPAARVRGQAWTTLTLAADLEPTPRTLDLLTEGFVNRTDRDAGLPAYAVITAAGNLAARLGTRPELLARTVELLRTIAEDPEVSPHDRRKAIAKLERYVSPAEVARLRALLH
jgi:hypothetical protein